MGKKIEDNHNKYYEEDGFNPEAIRVLSKEFGDYLFMGVDSLEDLEIFKTGFKNPQMLDVYEKKVAKNLLSISMNLFKIKPTTPLFRIRSISGIVRAYIWQQDFVQTEKYFKLLSSIDGEKSVKIQKCLSYYNIASFLEKKNLLREAEGKFKKIIELLMLFNLREEKGLIGGAYFHLGCIRQRMGETEKARDYFKECLKLIPDHNKARENLETLKGK